MSLRGKVALVTGASRGIGRKLAEQLAEQGVHVTVAAKTVTPDPRLPGTIHDAAEACTALGAEAMAIRMDVRDDAQVRAGVEETVARFGRLDMVVHNAGALWWKPIADTPVNRFDLVVGVNVRGAYALAHHSLPHLLRAGGGHFMVMSPPLVSESAAFVNKTAYMISKLGMTMVARGLSAEHGRDGISANSLWPETLIESSATVNFKIGNEKLWYKAELVADAAMHILCSPPGEITGQEFLCQDVLRGAGVDDFTSYRCDPEHEPPSMHLGFKPRVGGKERSDGRRGSLGTEKG